MREIKFRAWDTDAKRMRQPIEINFSMDEVYCEGGTLSRPVLMQFTGLLDSKGKEIFEGDILSYRYEISDKPFIGSIEHQNVVLEIGWEHDETLFSGFVINIGSEQKPIFRPIPNIEDIEIIGDIYRNPELLA